LGETRKKLFLFLLRNEEKVGDVFAGGQQRVVLIARHVEFGDRLEPIFREKDIVR